MSIVKNTIIYTIGAMIPQAAAFVLLPIYTNYLTPADYGLANTVQSLGPLLTALFTLGLNSSVYLLFHSIKTVEERKTFLGTIAIALFSLSSAFTLLLFALSGLSDKISTEIPFYPYFSYFILTLYFSVFSMIPCLFYQNSEQAGKYLALSMMQFLAGTGFVLWQVVVEKCGAAGMLKGAMLGNLISAPVYMVVLSKNVYFRFNPTIFRKALKLSLPLIPGLVGAWVLNLSDRLFIERYHTLHDVGIYSLGYKVAGLLLLLTSSFFIAYTPIFYKLANSADQDDARQTLYKYNAAFSLCLLCGAFLIAFFSKEAILLLLNAQYAEAIKIAPIIILGLVISQISGLFNVMIYQSKKTKYLMWLTLGSAMLNILLNLALVPHFGTFGAAYASVLSFLVMFIMGWLAARKCYYIPVNWKILSTVLAALIFLYVAFLFLPFSTLPMLIIKALLTLAALFFAYIKFYPNIREIIRP